ncbi:hypothetical protein SAMD00019534_050050, partial [Acytostelium subglobosum LB1]|uniref:hypothetical protein n=1 Tax=Acytostelium subglobosum LB1 TaxID=1410327 RepID=UPI000644F5F6
MKRVNEIDNSLMDISNSSKSSTSSTSSTSFFNNPKRMTLLIREKRQLAQDVYQLLSPEHGEPLKVYLDI